MRAPSLARRCCQASDSTCPVQMIEQPARLLRSTGPPSRAGATAKANLPGPSAFLAGTRTRRTRLACKAASYQAAGLKRRPRRPECQSCYFRRFSAVPARRFRRGRASAQAAGVPSRGRPTAAHRVPRSLVRDHASAAEKHRCAEARPTQRVRAGRSRVSSAPRLARARRRRPGRSAWLLRHTGTRELCRAWLLARRRARRHLHAARWPRAPSSPPAVRERFISIKNVLSLSLQLQLDLGL